MSASESTFYVTGGTLRHDAPSYLERKADKDLLDGLLKGEFCYVLTSRQMGKSSLMVRTASKLRDRGVNVISLDLTAIGQNLTPEQWYDGLVTRMGRQLRLEDELEEFWKKSSRLSPVQRWVMALHEVVMRQRPGPLVIFIDEIDTVRSLPFSTDEFFAAIRECYNRRTEDREFIRLTFCLLGVATPSDLIRDTRTTPFNIGRRVELSDFTVGEAAPLANGLGRDPQVGLDLLKRILFWTHGHPYLTQRLCQGIAGDESVRRTADVDRICEDLFLSNRARERDDNLLFVRERLLRAEVDKAGLLQLYGKVLTHKRAADDQTNPLVSILRLSGITRAEKGELRVRNHIYEHVFNREWVRANMPDAEVQRQRVSFRKGVLRAAGLAAVIVVAMGVLAAVALRQARNAREARTKTERVAEQLKQTLSRADFVTGTELLEKDQFGKGLSFLARSLRTEPNYGSAAVRLLSALTQRSYLLDHPPPMAADKPVVAAVFNKQGDRVYTRHTDESRRLWDTFTGKVLLEFGPDKKLLPSRGFSADGKMLVTITKDSVAQVWDARTGETITRPLALGADVAEIQTDVRTANEKLVAAIRSVEGSLQLRDLRDGGVLSPPLRSTGKAKKMGFTEGGRLFWGQFDDASIGFWEARTGKQVGKPIVHKLGNEHLRISRDDETALIYGDDNKVLQLWNIQTSELRCEPLRFQYRIAEAGFSQDGQRVVLLSTTDAAGKPFLKAQVLAVDTGKAVASITEETSYGQIYDLTTGVLLTFPDAYSLKVWDLATGQLQSTLPRQEKKLLRAQVSPDGNRLATASEDFSVRVWDIQSGKALTEPLKHGADIIGIHFSPDGEVLITTASDRTFRAWLTRTGEPLTEPITAGGFVQGVAFTSDRRSLLVHTLFVVSFGQVTEQTYGEVSRWSLHPGRALNDSLNRDTLVSHGKFSPDGKRILLMTGTNQTSTEVPKAYLLDVATKKTAIEFPHPDSVLGGALSPDGEIVVTISNDKIARIWDAATGKLLAGLKHDKTLGKVAISPDGTRVLTTAKDWTVRIWDVRSGQLLSDSIRHSNRTQVAKFSPDGKKILTASDDKTARVWDGFTGQPLTGPLVHKTPLDDACFSPDGRLVATAPFESAARVWDATTGRLLNELAPPFEDALRHVNFSPDGQKLVTTYGASYENPMGFACVWNWREGKLLTEPMKHPRIVWSARFSPDGKMIVTACEDGKTRLWDVETGKLLMEPIPDSLADYSPDGNQILTVSSGFASLWPLPPRHVPVPDWLPRLAEAIAGQKLSEQGGIESLSPESLRKIRQEISRLPDDDDYQHYAKWIFADRVTRAVAPYDALNLPEYVQKVVEEETEESLREAILLSPTNGIAFARLGRILAASTSANKAPSLDPHFLRPAMWYATQATNLAPNSAEAWWSLADLLDQVGKTDAALQAADQALVLDAKDPNAWIIKAFILASRGQTEAANAAYAKAKELAAAITDAKAKARTKKWFSAANLVNRLHNYGEAAAANLEHRSIVKRHERTKPNLIDLTAFYNAALTEDWFEEGKNLAGLPAGIQTIAGVEFDVRGMVRLNSQSDHGETYPRQILGIPVGLSAQRLHFLHAGNLSQAVVREGMLIGRYVIHLADGQEREVPLVVGPGYMHWRNWQGADNLEKKLVPAWKGDSESTRQTGRYVRLFKATWENSSPHVAIKSIDFISSQSDSSPFLVALTAQTETAPVITQQPKTVTVQLGESARFTVATKSSVAAGYQWRFNEKEIYGATNATLAFERVTLEAVGSYSVEVRNAGADSVVAETSQPAGLLVKDGALVHGALRREVFKGILGGKLSDLTNHTRFPDRPDVSDFIFKAEVPNNMDDYYGVRISGFVIPPWTGDYIFYICSDDQGALFLSTDETPSHKVQIAAEPEWNAPRHWMAPTRRPNQENISKPIPLEEGRRYYIEALMKEGEGGDCLGVVWQLPGGVPPVFGDPPIPGTYLAYPEKK